MSANRVVLIGMTFWALKAASGGMVIDSFDDANEGNWPITASTPFDSITVVDANVAGVVRGRRETTLFTESLDTTGVDHVRANLFPAVGLLEYESSMGGDGELQLRYRGNSAGAGLNIDLSGHELIRIEFDDLSIPGTRPIRVRVFLNEGRPPGMGDLEALLTSQGAQSLDFPFADFHAIENIDLSNLDNMLIFFDPPPGTHFRVQQIILESTGF